MLVSALDHQSRLTQLNLKTDFAQNTPILPISTDPSISMQEDSMCLFPRIICQASRFDTFTFCVALWSTIQLSWTLIVLAGQSFQITRQLTTYELSNLGRHGYMGGRGGQSLSSQQSHPTVQRLTAQAEEQGLPPPGTRQCSRHAPGHKHSSFLTKILPGGLLSVLGLDLYTKGKGR